MINPQLWATCLLISALAFGGGYLKGSLSEKKDCEFKEVKAENAALKEVDKKEQKAAVNLSNIGKNYAEEKKQNISAFNANSFNGLRVKSACANMPTVADAGSRIDAAGTEERQRTSEVDFADIANQIAKLGFERDEAVIKVNKLQAVVIEYQEICGIIKP